MVEIETFSNPSPLGEGLEKQAENDSTAHLDCAIPNRNTSTPLDVIVGMRYIETGFLTGGGMPSLYDELRQVTDQINALEARRQEIVRALNETFRSLLGDSIVATSKSELRSIETAAPEIEHGFRVVDTDESDDGVDVLLPGERRRQVTEILRGHGPRGCKVSVLADRCGTTEKAMGTLLSRGTRPERGAWTKRVGRGRYALAEFFLDLMGDQQQWTNEEVATNGGSAADDRAD